MPVIESIRTIDEKQRVARVRVDRTDLIISGVLFPHFEGKRYRALGGMSLIDGPDGAWVENGHGITRLVEVVVVPDGHWPHKGKKKPR